MTARGREGENAYPMLFLSIHPDEIIKLASHSSYMAYIILIKYT